jgi:Ca2+-binding RTX toxin-like protein
LSVPLELACGRRRSIASTQNRKKELSKMRIILGQLFRMGPTDQAGANRARSRRLVARVEGLENRNLMTGGSVVQTGVLVTITPAPAATNVAIVSDQTVKGTTMLDVNLNGSNNYFSSTQVGLVFYMGGGLSGSQTFQNTTSLSTYAWGGSGSNLFEGGTGSDEFFGGSGANTFDAGSGFDWLIGGLGSNTFNENAVGSGVIQERGTNNTINVPSGASGTYWVL